MEEKSINKFEMSNLDENMDWQNEFPHLAKLNQTNPYRVPEDYFESLTDQIASKIFLESIKDENRQSFTVPELYFDELPEQIEGRIAVERIKELVNNDGFTTPEGYFNKLSNSILAKTTEEVSKPKVVKLWQTKLFKYASAACLVILTGSGVYYNNYHAEQQRLAAAEFATEKMLYDIDENVIREHVLDATTEVSNVASSAEMESYILNNLSSSDITNNM